MSTERPGILISVRADIRSLLTDLNKATKSINNYGRQMAASGRQLTAYYTLPLLAAGAAAVKAAGDLDMMERALGAQMGSLAAAKEELESLRKAALAPGLEFRQAVTGSIRLQSMGLSADAARSILLGLGKATELSAGGAEEFGRAMVQIVQILGKGKILQEDWRRVVDAVPAANKALQELWGTTNIQAIREMGVTAGEFVAKFTDWMNRAEGSGESLKNTLENVGTTVWYLGANMGKAIVEAFDLNKVFNELTKWMLVAAVKIRYMDDGQKAMVKTLAKVALGIAALGPLKVVFGSIAWAAGSVLTVLTQIFRVVVAMRKANIGGILMDVLFGKGGAAAGTKLASLAGGVGSAILGILASALALVTGIAYAFGEVSGHFDNMEKAAGKVLGVWEKVKSAVKLAIAFTGGGTTGVGLGAEMAMQQSAAYAEGHGATGGARNRTDLYRGGAKAKEIAAIEGGDPMDGIKTIMGDDLYNQIMQALGNDPSETPGGAAPTDYLKEYASGMKELEAAFSLTGDAVAFYEGKVALAESTFVGLMSQDKIAAAEKFRTLWGEWSEELKKLNEEAAKVKLPDVMKDLAEAMSQADAAFAVSGDKQSYLASKASALESAMISMRVGGFGSTTEYSRAQVALFDVRKELDAIANPVRTVNDVMAEMTKSFMNAEAMFGFTGDKADLIQTKISAITSAFEELNDMPGTEDLISKLKNQFQVLSELLGKVQNDIDGTTSKVFTIGGALRDHFKDFAAVAGYVDTLMTGMGDSIAEALAGGAGASKSFIRAMLEVVKAIVKVIVAGYIQSVMQDTTIPNPFVKIGLAAAGGALVLGIVSGLAKRAGGTEFAKGGIVSGRLDGATIGEYIGANNNPEVVAPLDKLQSMIDGGKNIIDVHVDGHTRGDDIHYAVRRAEYRAARVGGPRIK